jgi:uncharacterized protein (DUF4415 family)
MRNYRITTVSGELVDIKAGSQTDAEAIFKDLHPEMAIKQSRPHSLRGGLRQGTGRPTQGAKRKKQYNLRLDADIVAWVDSVTDNRAEFLEEAIGAAKRSNLVVVRLDQYESVHGKLKESVSDWNFNIKGEIFSHAGSYSEAEDKAVSKALEVGVRAIDLLPSPVNGTKV